VPANQRPQLIDAAGANLEEVMKQAKWISLLFVGLISCAPAQQRSPEERFPLKAGQVWILNTGDLRPLNVKFTNLEFQIEGPIKAADGELSVSIKAGVNPGRLSYKDSKLDLQVKTDPNSTSKLAFCMFPGAASDSTSLEGSGFATDISVTNSGLAADGTCSLKLKR
jgi:hypothetical protein